MNNKYFSFYFLRTIFLLSWLITFSASNLFASSTAEIIGFQEDNSQPSPAIRTEQQLQPLMEYRGNDNNGVIVNGSVQRSQAVAPPTNDACASATSLVVNAGCVNGTTDQGTIQTGELAQPSCATTAFTQTVWYAFTATSTTMFVQLNTTGTFYGTGATWYPNNWASAVYRAGASCPPTAANLINCQYHSSVGTSDGVIVNTLSGLTIGARYLVQVGYALPTGGGPSGVIPQFCIKVGDQFTPVCNRCATACGPACGFSTAPTVAQVTSSCPAYNQNPFLEGSVADTQCYTFFASNTTVSFNVILNSTCGTGNVTNFTWTLHNAGCTQIQSGTLSNLTFNNLTIGQRYTYCYSFAVPASCYHTAYWPYFVGASPLPIELSVFTATAIDGKVSVEWSTATEINNDFFTIERSHDGESFEILHTQKGAGNSSQELNYSFIDEKPLPGISYYRLKQTDFDGTSSYSEVVAVKLTSEATDFRLYPNPAKGNVSLFFASELNGNCKIKLVDISGREVLCKQLLNNSRTADTTLDVSSLQSGIYYVSVQTASGIATQRLVLE